MPELPEVETVVLGLRGLLPGHKIQGISTDWPKSLRISEGELRRNVLNVPVDGIDRIGKMILIHLKNQYSLIIHLKLSGQLVYRQIENRRETKRFGAGHPSKSLVSSLPDKTTRAVIELDRQATLFFNDMRKFGWIKIMPTQLLKELEIIGKLGPDALDISDTKFVQILQKRKKSIKACLLDQTIIAGCGNIYADESLWLSEIHPRTPANQIREGKLKNLNKQLKSVLKLSIKLGGSSSRNYVNALGERGSYLDFVKVYQRTGQPCARCSKEIERIVVAGRGTHICPKCQRYGV